MTTPTSTTTRTTPETTMPATFPTTTQTDDGLVVTLTGHEAIEYAEAHDVVLSKHADPVQPAVESIDPDDAREVVESDPALVYCTADARIVALKRHLDCAFDEVSGSRYGENTFEAPGRSEYLVLTDEEADDAAKEEAKRLLWACSTGFLRRFVPALRDSRAEKAWEKVGREVCEDVQPLVEALLGDRLEEAVDCIVSEDGRGHALSNYDGEEQEQEVGGTTFYLYRTN